MVEYKFIKLIKLPKTDKKKYSAVFENLKTGREKNIKFGAQSFQNYTEGHLDEERKKRYIDRHKKNENWNDPLTAGYWSRWWTWEFKTFSQARKYVMNDLKKKGFL